MPTVDVAHTDIQVAEATAQPAPRARSTDPPTPREEVHRRLRVREVLGHARRAMRALARPDWTQTSTFENRWLWLLLSTRVLGTITAVVLLIFHRVTPHDGLFAIAVLAYSIGSLAAFSRIKRLQHMPAAWVIDTLIPFALIVLAREWRSPFYLMALTTLVLPATTLAYRRALAWGLGFSVAYFGIAFSTRLDWQQLRYTSRLETFVTHLMVPLLVALALAYAADVLERLREERERTEKLAIEAERQRIAWDLHDSAKQRVHAAHLVLSSLEGRTEPSTGEIVALATKELQSAIADMETSLGELRTPLEGRRLDAALRQRAEELAPATTAAIDVRGKAPRLGPFAAAHAYSIASEALVNAVRHARAERIDVRLGIEEAAFVVEIADDGQGMPAAPRPGSTGLRSMRGRATAIGGTLSTTAGAGGRGTVVRLELPLTPTQGGSA